MSLTIKTFLSNYILKPWEVEDPKKRKLAWAASIILGCASALTMHAGCALVKYAVIPFMKNKF